MKIFIVAVLLFSYCVACKRKEEAVAGPDVPFDKIKWASADGGDYRYRRQMVNDLVKNYHWTNVSKDSLLRMLGAPDDIEGDVFYLYYYEKKPLLGGVMSQHKAITFELRPGADSVKSAKLGEGAEWGN
jgi:hypothetical protein